MAMNEDILKRSEPISELSRRRLLAEKVLPDIAGLGNGGRVVRCLAELEVKEEAIKFKLYVSAG